MHEESLKTQNGYRNANYPTAKSVAQPWQLQLWSFLLSKFLIYSDGFYYKQILLRKTLTWSEVPRRF